MKLISSHIDMLAYEIGMQAVMRHATQCTADAYQGRIADLEKVLQDAGVPIPPLPGQEPKTENGVTTTTSADGRHRTVSYSGEKLAPNGNGPLPGQEGVDGSNGNARHVPLAKQRGYDHVGKDGRNMETPPLTGLAGDIECCKPAPETAPVDTAGAH